MSEKTLLI